MMVNFKGLKLLLKKQK